MRGAYSFTSVFAAIQLLVFPGVFSPTGLLGAGPQTAVWIWVFWHGGFPALVTASLFARSVPASLTHRTLARVVAVGAVAVTVGLCILATAGQSHLPPLVARSGSYTQLSDSPAGIIVEALCLAALGLHVSTTRVRSLMDLWLAVALVGALLDVTLTLSAGARYSVGWYAARDTSMVSSSAVLGMLIYETTGLYRRLSETHRKLVETSARDGLTGVVKGHELDVKLPARPLYVEADRLRLAQVLANLLTNAAKYTPPGGRIELTVVADAAEIVIAVTDNGIGIESGKFSALFSMFSQVNPDHHRQGGLGIGLALSKSLIELHGGRVTVSSAGKDRGSCFAIHLPASLRVMPASLQTLPTSASSVGKHRILVVDDNIDAADAMTAFLELEGHEVRTAYSGEEALDILTHYGAEVILLDLGLPGMSGLDVGRRVRTTPNTKDVTLIAITGWGQPQDRLRTAKAGFDFHFTKPVDVGRLNLAIASAATASQTMPDST
ncbi:MASE4 domain-containing protein [Paraburkholderia caledonica]|uniref:histidine kinase n=1 Tax=Paraburkholderia caledonica TaxID=134536 RepID=A0AB73ITS7_9BURK|nr:CheY-like chemotaxis protein [Paraburkholderia caledonica]